MSLLKRIRRSPLWLQITAFLLLGTLVASLAGGKFLRDLVKEYLTHSIVEQTKKTFSIVSAVSIEAVVSEDIPVLKSVVQQASEKDPNILAITIETQSGSTLVDWKRENQPLNLKDTLPLSEDIIVEGQNFGKMKWLLDIGPMINLVEDHVWQVQLMFVAILVVFTVLVILGIHQVAVHPIGLINERLVTLASGDLESTLELNAADELVRLGESVNDLVGASRLQRQRQKELREAQQSLKESHAKLAEYSRTLEDQVAARTAELAAAVSEAQAARKVSEEANRAKSSFLANMSHELRTPLNAIIGYSEMLKEEAEDGDNLDPKSMTGDLLKITSAGKHLLGVINDVLDLSKIEAGKMDVFLERFEIEKVIQAVTELVEPKLVERKNTLKVECQPGIGSMLSDLTKVRQTVLNLLANSCKFTENGTISVRVKSESTDGAEYILFSVADTGIGMSAEQIRRLFQPFSQADSSMTRKFGGTGLGLTITRHFCRLLKGDVWVESELGKGSVFHIKLPREAQRPDDEGGKSASASIAIPQATRKLSAQQTGVLVIDDDPNVHELIRRALPRDEYHVISASSGEQGISYARLFNPDLITLDIKMPGADGLEILKTLKQIPELADIPIVVVSVVDERSKALELGAAGFLLKPVNKDKLLQLLSTCRTRTAGSQPQSAMQH